MGIHSIREQLLLAVLASLRPIAMELGAGIHRSPSLAITRDKCPALLVFPESEAITQSPNNRAHRELLIRVVVLARAIPPATPETEADQLMTAAHAALMANVNLDGFALKVEEVDCEWDIEDADATAASFTTRYRITYRTLLTDLTISG